MRRVRAGRHAALGSVRLAVPESRRTLAIYIAAGATFAALSARGLTVPLYAHGLGANRFEVGALFSVSPVSAALLSMPSGLLIDRFGARTLLGVSIAIAAVSQVAIAASTTVAPLFLWQAIGGLGFGATQAAFFSAITESVGKGRLGRAMGWLTFSMQAGFFIGPSIAGIALQWIDIRTDIALTTTMLVFALPGIVAASRTQQSQGGFASMGHSGRVSAHLRQGEPRTSQLAGRPVAGYPGRGQWSLQAARRHVGRQSTSSLADRLRRSDRVVGRIGRPGPPARLPG